MTYLLCLNAFLLVAVGTWLSHLATWSKKGRTAREVAEQALVLLAGIFIGLPLLTEISNASMMSGEGVPLGKQNWYWAETLAGGLLAASTLGYRLWRQRGTETSLTNVGLTTTGTLIGLYMAFVGADQWHFMGDGKNAGLLNWSYLKEEAKLKGIECESDYMVVADVKAELIAYRCPTRLILGKFSGQPFVPWPAYTEGKSKEMGTALTKMLESAKNHSNEQ